MALQKKCIDINYVHSPKTVPIFEISNIIDAYTETTTVINSAPDNVRIKITKILISSTNPIELSLIIIVLKRHF